MFLVRIGKEKYLAVMEITTRWYDKDAIFVRVLLEDDRIAVLRYYGQTDEWKPCLIPVRAGDEDFTQGVSVPGNPEWAASARAMQKPAKPMIIQREDIPAQEMRDEQASDSQGPEEIPQALVCSQYSHGEDQAGYQQGSCSGSEDYPDP